MAIETVTETPDTHNGAGDALQKTAQVIAVLRVVMLAVQAQEDGSVHFEDNSFSRWGPAVDAARLCLFDVRDVVMNRPHPHDAGDWWTPLALIEALGAALWFSNCSKSSGWLSSEDLQGAIGAAIDSLNSLLETLSGVASLLLLEAKDGAI